MLPVFLFQQGDWILALCHSNVVTVRLWICSSDTTPESNFFLLSFFTGFWRLNTTNRWSLVGDASIPACTNVLALGTPVPGPLNYPCHPLASVHMPLWNFEDNDGPLTPFEVGEILQWRTVHQLSLSLVDVTKCLRNGKYLSCPFTYVFCSALFLSASPSLPLHCSLENCLRESVWSCQCQYHLDFFIFTVVNVVWFFCKSHHLWCALWRCQRFFCTISSPPFESSFAVQWSKSMTCTHIERWVEATQSCRSLNRHLRVIFLSLQSGFSLVSAMAVSVFFAGTSDFDPSLLMMMPSGTLKQALFPLGKAEDWENSDAYVLYTLGLWTGPGPGPGPGYCRHGLF